MTDDTDETLFGEVTETRTASADEMRADALIDYALAHEDGFTYVEATAALGFTNPAMFPAALRIARQTCADEDVKWNIVCEPQGVGPWRYRVAATHEDARAWGNNRMLDANSRLQTQTNVWRSIVAATDGRTPDGKKARATLHILDALKSVYAAIDGGSI